jgi:hypothetical protein
MITDPKGQWAHPGKNTRIPSNDITMNGVNYPVWAVPNVGEPMMMQPGGNYNFPGADYVDEYPMQDGGYVDMELTDEQIAQYRAGGFVVEELPKTQGGYTVYKDNTYVDRQAIPHISDQFINPTAKYSSYAIDESMNNTPLTSSESAINTREQKEFKKALDFHKGWINSPQYKRMLMHSLDDPYIINDEGEDYNIYNNKRKFNLNTIPGLNVLKSQPEGKSNAGGWSFNDSGVVDVAPSGYDIKGLYRHEISHSTDRPYSRPLYQEKERLIPKQDVDLINSFKPEGNDLNNNWVDYITEPTEVRARLNDIRGAAKNLNIYDPYTKKLTPENYKKLKETKLEKGNWDPLKQLQGVYSDEQIIELLNTISDTGESDNHENTLQTAQDGGFMELELTDAEIAEYRRGGYVVEELPKAQYGQLQPFGPRDGENFWTNVENAQQSGPYTEDTITEMAGYEPNYDPPYQVPNSPLPAAIQAQALYQQVPQTEEEAIQLINDRKYINPLEDSEPYDYLKNTIGETDQDYMRKVYEDKNKRYGGYRGEAQELFNANQALKNKQQGGGLSTYTGSDKVLTYKDDSDWFDNHASYHDNPTFSNMIRQYVYSGKYGYNPKTGVLVPLKKEQHANVSDEVKAIREQEKKNIVKRDKYRAMSPEDQKEYRNREFRDAMYKEGRHPVRVDDIGGGYNQLDPDFYSGNYSVKPWEGKAGKTVWLTDAEEKAYDKDWVAKSMQKVGEHPLFYAPGMVGSFGAPGGMASMIYQGAGTALAQTAQGDYKNAATTGALTALPFMRPFSRALGRTVPGFERTAQSMNKFAGKYVYPKIYGKTMNKIEATHRDWFANKFMSPEGQVRLREMGINPEQLEQPMLTWNPGESSWFRTGTNQINIDPKQLPRLRMRLGMKPSTVYEHELGHWLQKEATQHHPRYLSDLQRYEEDFRKFADFYAKINPGTPESFLRNLYENTKGALGSKPPPGILPSGFDDFMLSSKTGLTSKPNLSKFGKSNYDYFKFESGKEPLAHLREMRDQMVKRGYLKDVYAKADEEMILNYITKYAWDDRIASFLEPTMDNLKKIKTIMNRAPVLLPAIGTAAAFGSGEFRDGGTTTNDMSYNYFWDKLQQGGEPAQNAQPIHQGPTFKNPQEEQAYRQQYMQMVKMKMQQQQAEYMRALQEERMRAADQNLPKTGTQYYNVVKQVGGEPYTVPVDNTRVASPSMYAGNNMYTDTTPGQVDLGSAGEGVSSGFWEELGEGISDFLPFDPMDMVVPIHNPQGMARQAKSLGQAVGRAAQPRRVTGRKGAGIQPMPSRQYGGMNPFAELGKFIPDYGKGGAPCFECGGQHFQEGGPNMTQVDIGDPNVEVFQQDPNADYNMYQNPDEARAYDEAMTQYMTAKEAYDAEKARVEGVRGEIVNVGERALNPDEQSQILKHRITPGEWNNFNPYYCSTRSCEIERAAGVTIPGDVTINKVNYPAGSAEPIIPGTQQWVSNAEKLGYGRIDPKDQQPGDRVFGLTEAGDPGSAFHSLIYAGTDENGNPVYYNDHGRGDSYSKDPSYWRGGLDANFSTPQAAYRYHGNMPALEQQMNEYEQALSGIPMSKIKPRPIEPIPTDIGNITPPSVPSYQDHINQIEGSDMSRREKKKALKNLEKSQRISDIYASSMSQGPTAYFQDGGGYEDMELSDDEIADLRAQGYNVQVL